MARRRHLERAPITEALINFRVELSEGFHPDRFDQLADVFRHRFPKKASQKVLHAGFGVRNGQTLTQAQELQHRGLILKTKRELEIMQLRLDGFTFNRLRPYTSWEQIFPESVQILEEVSGSRESLSSGLAWPSAISTFSTCRCQRPASVNTWNLHQLCRGEHQMWLVAF